LADGPAAEGVDDGIELFFQKLGIDGHIAAVLGFLIEEGAEGRVRLGFAAAEDTVDVEGLLRLRCVIRREKPAILIPVPGNRGKRKAVTGVASGRLRAGGRFQ